MKFIDVDTLSIYAVETCNQHLSLPAIVVLILPMGIVRLLSQIPFLGVPYPHAMFLLVIGLVFMSVGSILLYSILVFCKKRALRH